ncbi:hypothetical protein [Flagellimonas halotolerans]
MSFRAGITWAREASGNAFAKPKPLKGSTPISTGQAIISPVEVDT